MHRSLSFVVLLVVAATPCAFADHLPNTLNFANVTSGRIVWTVSEGSSNEKEVDFGDFDNDGDLDVVVANGRGAGREGVTEAVQETIKDATVSLASGKPFFTVETAEGAAESFVSGVMVGGTLAAPGGARGGPPRTGVREGVEIRLVQEAAIRAPQDNLSEYSFPRKRRRRFNGE